MNRLVLGLALVLASSSHAARQPDQTMHDDYLDKLDGSSVSLHGMRIVVRVYDSPNSGTNTVYNLDMNPENSSARSFELNTAGDNLERNHIDTFWYCGNFSAVTTSQLWTAQYDPPLFIGTREDWFQYDTVTYTNFVAPQSVWVERDDLEPSSEVDARGALQTASSSVDVYALRVHTKDSDGSDTDGKVYARLVWADGDQTDWLRLDNPWKNDFERGEDDLFFLPVMDRPNGDNPIDVELWHKSSTRWTADRVQLVREIPTSTDITLSTVFDESGTLSVGGSCGSSLDACSETRSLFSTEFSLIAETGTKGDASSDSKFYGRIKLADGSYTPYKQLDLPGNTFEEKAVETFSLHVPDHLLTTSSVAGVEIKTTGSDGWRPRSIKLKQGSTTLVDKTFTGDSFRIDDDCSSDVRTGCAPRVLITTSGDLQ